MISFLNIPNMCWQVHMFQNNPHPILSYYIANSTNCYLVTCSVNWSLFLHMTHRCRLFHSQSDPNLNYPPSHLVPFQLLGEITFHLAKSSPVIYMMAPASSAIKQGFFKSFLPSGGNNHVASQKKDVHELLYFSSIPQQDWQEQNLVHTFMHALGYF